MLVLDHAKEEGNGGPALFSRPPAVSRCSSFAFIISCRRLFQLPVRMVPEPPKDHNSFREMLGYSCSSFAGSQLMVRIFLIVKGYHRKICTKEEKNVRLVCLFLVT
jgi:hypothetical protein